MQLYLNKWASTRQSRYLARGLQNDLGEIIKKWETAALTYFRKHQYSDFVGKRTAEVTEIKVSLPQH